MLIPPAAAYGERAAPCGTALSLWFRSAAFLPLTEHGGPYRVRRRKDRRHRRYDAEALRAGPVRGRGPGETQGRHGVAVQLEDVNLALPQGVPAEALAHPDRPE